MMNAAAEPLDPAAPPHADSSLPPEVETVDPYAPPPPSFAASVESPHVEAAAAAGPPLPKSPRVAAFFALFPGLGHVYNGLYQRGAVFFGLFALTIVLAAETGGPLFGLMIPFIFLFSVLDAYRQANLINLGYATDLGLHDQPQRLRPGQGALILGVTLLGVGALELMERAGLWRWEWLADYWPVPVMLVGAWLVFAALRERRKAQREAISDSYGEGT